MEQLAADRLDRGDDNSALAAMGYLTLGRRFLNNLNDIIDDRIDVMTRGMLGLTVACAMSRSQVRSDSHRRLLFLARSLCVLLGT